MLYHNHKHRQALDSIKNFTPTIKIFIREELKTFYVTNINQYYITVIEHEDSCYQHTSKAWFLGEKKTCSALCTILRIDFIKDKTDMSIIDELMEIMKCKH